MSAFKKQRKLQQCSPAASFHADRIKHQDGLMGMQGPGVFHKYVYLQQIFYSSLHSFRRQVSKYEANLSLSLVGVATGYELDDLG
jgi:hypothetical protein